VSEKTPAPPVDEPPLDEARPEAPRRDWGEFARDLATGSFLRTFLAIVLAFAAGSLLIVFTNEDVQSSLGYIFARPSDFFGAAGSAIGDAYVALFRGSIYNFTAASPEAAWRPLTQTFFFAGPLIAAGLGIALSFRVGMFNIGGSGQLLMGAAFAAWASFTLHLPYGLHLIVAMLFGFLGAGLWAGIVGVLKATTGAHEVIVTIMMNYIAASFITYLMRTPVLHDMESGNNPTTRPPDVTAQFPKLIPDADYNLHFGIILCIAAVVVYWWLMERSTIGYRFRMVGLNPDAARTAGIDIRRVYIIAMVCSGLFVGLAGIYLALGRSGNFGPSVESGIGFDAITVALLGGSRGPGILLAGLLFGAMKAGGTSIQVSGVPPEVLAVIQGLIVLFVAAPPLVRAIFRLPAPRAGKEPPQSGTRKKPVLESEAAA
jgi:ABC-type uncharacterized transport system permease subunit